AALGVRLRVSSLVVPSVVLGVVPGVVPAVVACRCASRCCLGVAASALFLALLPRVAVLALSLALYRLLSVHGISPRWPLSHAQRSPSLSLRGPSKTHGQATCYRMLPTRRRRARLREPGRRVASHNDAAAAAS